MNTELTLYTIEGLFLRAKAEGKLDQFTDQFWTAFSHNNSLTYKEAQKILESI